jgi:hypothetical protein
MWANASTGSATASSLFTANTMLGTRSSFSSSEWRRVCVSNGSAGGPVELGGVDQHHGGIGTAGGRDHVARVLLVAGRVANDELAPSVLK